MNAIEIVQLNEIEKTLYAAVIWATGALSSTDYEERMRSLENMGLLAESLLVRKAIPHVRLRFFTDPDMNIGGYGKSRKAVFERNGKKEKDILRHPHFAPFLQYFINGPALPKLVIDGFCKIIEDDAGTSGMVLDQIRAYVRQAVRDHGLNEDQAADEFFKLAHEIEQPDLAASVRSAAKSVR